MPKIPKTGPKSPQSGVGAIGEPGSSSSQVGSQVSQNTLKIQGETRIDGLVDAIRTNRADRPTAPVKEKYDVHSEASFVTPDLRGQMRSIGQVEAARGEYVEYTVKNRVDPSRDGPIYQFKISRDKGVIINEVSYASRDNLGDDVIRFSEQLYAGWADVGATNNIGLMVQRNIQNDATRALFPAGNGKATINPGTDEYKKIVGSANGRPFARFLEDHHQVLGDKQITKIELHGGSRPNIYFFIG